MIMRNCLTEKNDQKDTDSDDKTCKEMMDDQEIIDTDDGSCNNDTLDVIEEKNDSYTAQNDDEDGKNNEDEDTDDDDKQMRKARRAAALPKTLKKVKKFAHSEELIDTEDSDNHGTEENLSATGSDNEDNENDDSHNMDGEDIENAEASINQRSDESPAIASNNDDQDDENDNDSDIDSNEDGKDAGNDELQHESTSRARLRIHRSLIVRDDASRNQQHQESEPVTSRTRSRHIVRAPARFTVVHTSRQRSTEHKDGEDADNDEPQRCSTSQTRLRISRQVIENAEASMNQRSDESSDVTSSNDDQDDENDNDSDIDSDEDGKDAGNDELQHESTSRARLRNCRSPIV